MVRKLVMQSELAVTSIKYFEKRIKKFGLTHFNPLSANPTKWSNTLKRETTGFLMFLGGIEIEHWVKMG